MKITIKQNVKKHQMGGQMQPTAPVEDPAAMEGAPVEGEAPAPSEQQDPMAMLAELAMQALQGQDCQAAMQVCQAILEIMQQTQAPQEPQGEPVFARHGAKLTISKRIKH